MFLEFETMERRIKRSLLYLQCLARHLLDPLRDGVAVNWAKRNDPHDEQIEGTLGEVKPVFSLHAYSFYIHSGRVEGQGISEAPKRSSPYKICFPLFGISKKMTVSSNRQCTHRAPFELTPIV